MGAKYLSWEWQEVDDFDNLVSYRDEDEDDDFEDEDDDVEWDDEEEDWDSDDEEDEDWDD